MTICDKINDVGETLQENLNNRGVDCTFGTGTGESTVLEMVEMVNGTNFRGSSDVNLKIGANRPYLLENETTDVVVKLENGLCEPLKNKNVIVGKSVFRDGGVTGNSNLGYWYWNSTYGTGSVGDDGTTFNATTTSYLTISATLTSPSTSNIYVYNFPLTVEFDIVSFNDPVEITSNYSRVRVYNNTNNKNAYWNIKDYGVGHYKIVCTESSQKLYFNGVEQSRNFTFTPTTAWNIAFQTYGNIKFKNFVVYENLNGVTDEKGEFALYNVSVSDDTIFNATYGTETATCLVEYCRFVDYAVKDNHNHNYFNQQGTSKCTITENDSYKEFKTIGAIGCNVYIGSSTSYIGFDVGNTWTIIWDKLYIDGYTVAFQCYNGSTSLGINSTTLNLHNSDFQELKFVCDGSSIKAYVDGVYKTQTSYTSTGHGYLRINLNNNNGASQVTFRAKNIRIK